MSTATKSAATHADLAIHVYLDGRLIHAAAQRASEADRAARPLDRTLAAAAELHAQLRNDAGGGRCVDRPSTHEPLQRHFEVMAQATPCAKAVSFNGHCLTYGELDAQADALALHLQTLGVTPESFCWIDLAPSLAQVRAVLAVLKAGAACLHCDPAIDARAKATTLAVIKPAIRLASRDAGDTDAALRTIPCAEAAAELPDGWPNELPVSAHTPASAQAALSADGELCIHVRTHRFIHVAFEAADGLWKTLTHGPAPVARWKRALSGPASRLAVPD